MIKSMTGYGKAEFLVGTGRVLVEIRSVNHRYGEIYIKLPRIWLSIENDIKKAVSGRLKRGKVEVFIQLQNGGGGEILPAVNIPLARAYAAAFEQLKNQLGLIDPVTLPLLLAQKDVLTVGEAVEADENVVNDLMAAVITAVENLDIMRVKEGEALLTDIRQRQDRLPVLLDQVAERAPVVVTDYAARVKDRLDQLLGERTMDDARLAQEVALMADRFDITEELVRFRSHLQQLDETLVIPDAVGRKLDFILQEMNREVNTIGSKANDSVIAGLVVELKSELEKIREQVQNIE